MAQAGFYEGQGKEEYIQNIFTVIAKRYDLMNSLLSFNQDRYWRKTAVGACRIKPGQSVLDIGCGTGKLSLELAKSLTPAGLITGVDICSSMLEVARKNLDKTPYGSHVKLIQENALNLSFADEIFDVVISGFLLRNTADHQKALREMIRVLKPGGRIVTLELSMPNKAPFSSIYSFYFNYLLPWIGRAGTGTKSPYRYLPASVRVYPGPDSICQMLKSEGLRNVNYTTLSWGIAVIHVGEKPL